MAEPPGSLPPGSPKIKKEPQDTPSVAPAFNAGEEPETIDISDDEEEVVAQPLGSPFHEQPQQEEPKTTEAINLGPSLLLSKPKPANPDLQESLRLQVQEARRKTAQRLRQKPIQRTPDPVGRSEMFVTDSYPGTPNAADVFKTLQRDVEAKRRNGTLTWQEDIQFERAQAAEEARVLKERLDKAYDASEHSPSDDDDPLMSPEVASLPDVDDDLGEPKKRGGRKRKADSASQAQPKKRRAPNKSTEDILVVARRKEEAKAKAKSAAGKTKTKEKSAPTKQGRKKKPTAPDLLNTNSMLGSNVFNDTARIRDLPNQPTYEFDKHKDKALRSLIASVPEEYRPVAKTDSRFLEDAMRDFTGRGAVKPADDGNWSVKGMRVTLKHYQILGK
jgi:hypothetical protein